MTKVYYQNLIDFKHYNNNDYFLLCNPKMACLSIIDNIPSQFDLNSNWVLSKQVMFPDTDNELHPLALNDELALKIVQFLIEVKNNSDIDGIIIHCFAGVSRSRAVVLFFEEILNGNIIEDIKRSPFIQANKFVYRKLIKAYEKIIYEN